MAEKKFVLMQGNEAATRGAIAAGMRFYAGYPITPSTEIAEMSALLLPQVGGVFVQMEDEISSMAAIIGAETMGCKAMTATSGPGFSLMQENIGYASMTEVPCVVVDVQRAGPSTGLATSPAQADVMQARWGTHGDHPVIALSPSSVQETYSLIIRAFNLSEKYRVPVVFLMDEMVGHLREGIVIPDESELEIVNRKWPEKGDESWKPFEGDPETGVPVMPPFGQGWKYHITGLTHNEMGYPIGSGGEAAGNLTRRLMKKLEVNRDDIIQYDAINCEDADLIMVAFGGTARAATKAMKDAREQGKKVGLFRPTTIWPFADKELEKIAAGKKLLVIEHNYGQLLLEIQRSVHSAKEIFFQGCVDGTPLMPAEISAKIEEVL